MAVGAVGEAMLYLFSFLSSCFFVLVSGGSLIFAGPDEKPFFNFRDGNENFYLPVSGFKTKTRMSIIQSFALRGEFLMLHQEENKNFFLSIWCLFIGFKI